MQKQLEATDRPWLTVEFENSEPFVFEKDGRANLGMHYVIKNVGKSVAIGVMIRATMYPRDWKPRAGDAFEIQRQRDLCDTSKKRPDPTKYGFTIFPGTAAVDNLRVYTDPADMAKLAFVPNDSTDKYTSPVFVGCVDYHFSYSETIHQTGFAFEVSRIDPKRPGLPLMIPIGHSLPLGQFEMRKAYSMGEYAN
jgi:hypothetical protein